MCSTWLTMKRAGTTEKVSVSLQKDLLKTLRQRAKRLYAGNLSAVLIEVAEATARLEAQDELIQHFGWPALTDAERATIDTEWYGPTKKKTRASRVA